MDQLAEHVTQAFVGCTVRAFASCPWKTSLAIPQRKGTAHFESEFSLVFREHMYLKPGGRVARKELQRMVTSCPSRILEPDPQTLITHQTYGEQEEIWQRVLTSAHIF